MTKLGTATYSTRLVEMVVPRYGGALWSLRISSDERLVDTRFKLLRSSVVVGAGVTYACGAEAPAAGHTESAPSTPTQDAVVLSATPYEIGVPPLQARAVEYLLYDPHAKSWRRRSGRRVTRALVRSTTSVLATGQVNLGLGGTGASSSSSDSSQGGGKTLLLLLLLLLLLQPRSKKAAVVRKLHTRPTLWRWRFRWEAHCDRRVC